MRRTWTFTLAVASVALASAAPAWGGGVWSDAARGLHGYGRSEAFASAYHEVLEPTNWEIDFKSLAEGTTPRQPWTAPDGLVVPMDASSTRASWRGPSPEGRAGNLVLSVCDEQSAQLGECIVESWLWDPTAARQNCEPFFAARAGDAVVRRAEIRNAAAQDASAQVVDDTQLGCTGAPEPSVILVLCISGALLAAQRWHGRWCPASLVA